MLGAMAESERQGRLTVCVEHANASSYASQREAAVEERGFSRASRATYRGPSGPAPCKIYDRIAALSRIACYWRGRGALIILKACPKSPPRRQVPQARCWLGAVAQPRLARHMKLVEAPGFMLPWGARL